VSGVKFEANSKNWVQKFQHKDKRLHTRKRLILALLEIFDQILLIDHNLERLFPDSSDHLKEARLVFLFLVRHMVVIDGVETATAADAWEHNNCKEEDYDVDFVILLESVVGVLFNKDLGRIYLNSR
jgi:hypothetical protein